SRPSVARSTASRCSFRWPECTKPRSERRGDRRLRRRRAAGLPGLERRVGSAAGRPAADLKALAGDRQVVSVSYCRGIYMVALKDGSARTFKEYDLAFKTDTGPSGPAKGTPALVPTGRGGDRAFLVFSALDELKDALTTRC